MHNLSQHARQVLNCISLAHSAGPKSACAQVHYIVTMVETVDPIRHATKHSTVAVAMAIQESLLNYPC